MWMENWTKMSDVLCDKRIPLIMKDNIHKMVMQSAILYGIEMVSLSTCDTKRLKVTKIKRHFFDSYPITQIYVEVT